MGRFDPSIESTDGKNYTLLRVFGRTPIDAAARIEPVERELAMGIKSVDHAYLIERHGERYIEHFEAEFAIAGADWQSIIEPTATTSLEDLGAADRLFRAILDAEKETEARAALRRILKHRAR